MSTPAIRNLLIGILVLSALGGPQLPLTLIFVGIPFVATGWVFIYFMMKLFGNSGPVVMISGLTCVYPAYIVARACEKVLQAFMQSAGIS